MRSVSNCFDSSSKSEDFAVTVVVLQPLTSYSGDNLSFGALRDKHNGINEKFILVFQLSHLGTDPQEAMERGWRSQVGAWSVTFLQEIYTLFDWP
ncbi:MAG: hypothetical protein C5B49_16290 [Bdellovibrio sp.]|nr:MAG: hypothetical protein C5B49_16290 [Bdellovibrio sp.]